METPLTVGVREAARLLGVGQMAMYEAIRAGRVRVLRIGRRLRVARAELEDLARHPERFSRESRSRTPGT
jgi:excisionase family DNA binding protein